MEEQDSERVDIGSGGDGLTADLFGTGKFRCEANGNGSGIVAVGIEHFGDTEIEELDLAGFGDEDVGGLEIAMDNQIAMSERDGDGDIDKELEDLFDTGLVEFNVFVEGQAIDEFHDEVEKAVVG